MQSLSSLFSHAPSFNSHQFAPENNNNNSTPRFLLQDAFIKDDADQLISRNNQKQQHCNDDSEDEFEFAFASLLSPVPADQIFYNGQIRPLYPHSKVDNNSLVSCMEPRAARLPLRKLLVEERELDTSASSHSSSVTKELEGVEAGFYCIWDSKTTEESPELCKKSSNFKRWKLRDFLKTNSSSAKNSNFALSKYS